MKILISWLRDFVDVPGSPDDIAAKMSVRGFAVEGIETLPDGDAILDFEITANRPDCMSVIGIAREVATAYELPLRVPALPESPEAVASPPPTALRLELLQRSEQAGIDVVIDNPELCARYAGAVADVRVASSPDWLQARLRAGGVRPISNIVDITNYVLLELGQPMHAFDLTKLGGGQICVRTAKPGEKIRTLDSQMRELSPEMLVIADGQHPIAIAGVMGGADSEVGDTTTTIVFESAYFSPRSVRRTSKALGLKTEASMRFERGADLRLPFIAMERACALLRTIGAGQARGTVVDRHPAPVEARVLHLRRARITRVLGIDVNDADVARILESLGFSLGAREDGWDVTAPTRRVDVTREVDLIEEIARHYGFDRIAVTFPALTAAPPDVDPRITRARRLRSTLTGAGFSEAVTFGFVKPTHAAPFADAADIVAIANPLSESFGVLRPTLLSGLIAAVDHNQRRERSDVRLFELGSRFSLRAGERQALACAWSGAATPEHWSAPTRQVDFFDVKGVVDRICQTLGLDVTYAPLTAPIAWLVVGRAAAVMYRGAPIGLLGQLNPGVGEALGVSSASPIYVVELDLDQPDMAAMGGDRRVAPLPRFPSVTRDVSVLVDDTLAAATIRGTIQAAAPVTLAGVREFDRYAGKGVPDGKVSLSFHLTFRAPDRTLTDTEIQSAMDGVLASLVTQHNAVQR